MNNKNRHVLCGVLILIWLIPFCLGLVFSYQELGGWEGVQSDGVVVRSANGEIRIAYPGGYAGFPVRFIEITDFSNGDRVREYDLRRGLLNAALVGFNLIGIVVAVQKSSWQFSIHIVVLFPAPL